MKLQARRLGGDTTNARNIIETRIVFEEGEQLDKGKHSIVHSIENIKGSTVQHGGGVDAGVFLHYKSNEVDVDEDGDIDYTFTTIHTEMQYAGTSEIRVIAKVTDLVKAEAYQKLWSDWNELRTAKNLAVMEKHGPTLEAEKLMHFWEDDNPMPEDTESTTELRSGGVFLEWALDYNSSWV